MEILEMNRRTKYDFRDSLFRKSLGGLFSPVKGDIKMLRVRVSTTVSHFDTGSDIRMVNFVTSVMKTLTTTK